MADPLQGRNEFYRLFERFNRESLLVVLVGLSVASSLISWAYSASASSKAGEAIAMSTTWQQMYKETERECRLAQLEVDDFRMTLVKNGFQLEHGEKP